MHPVPNVGGAVLPTVPLNNAPTIPNSTPNLPGTQPPVMGSTPQIPVMAPTPQPAPTVVNVNYPTQPASPSIPSGLPPTPQQQPVQQQPAQPGTQYSKAQSSFMNSLKVSGADSTPNQNDQPVADQGQASFRRFQVPQKNQPAPDQPPAKSKDDEALWK
jgi:hypothetical protein